MIDNDYAPLQFPGTTPLTDLEVTLAHEYNHVLQFGYDAFQDTWFVESTATWMEDQVYDRSTTTCATSAAGTPRTRCR